MNIKAPSKCMVFFRNYLNTLKEVFFGGGVDGEMLWITKSLYMNFAFLQAMLRMKLSVLYL